MDTGRPEDAEQAKEFDFALNVRFYLPYEVKVQQWALECATTAVSSLSSTTLASRC